MNNFPRVTAILEKIPDAATRWPGWFWPVCGVMGFNPLTDIAHPDGWHGGDLDARNMHHLWAMLEAVDVCGLPEISFSDGEHSVTAISLAGDSTGQSHNIIEAMLRCLEGAVK